MRITRFPALSEAHFFGCTAAFVDSLFGELNAAAGALRRLEGQAKGAAFAYEMALDTHRYGALIVLDRWSALLTAYRPHLHLSRHPAIAQEGGARVRAAEGILGGANQVLDAAERYSPQVVQACLLAFQSLRTTFAQERDEAEQTAKLGPLVPADYTAARRIFLEDLAAR